MFCFHRGWSNPKELSHLRIKSACLNKKNKILWISNLLCDFQNAYPYRKRLNRLSFKIRCLFDLPFEIHTQQKICQFLDRLIEECGLKGGLPLALIDRNLEDSRVADILLTNPEKIG